MDSQRRRTIATAGRLAFRQVRPLLAVVLMHGGAASAAQTWPTVPIPQGVATFAMGDEVTVNGLPLRMRGLLSSQPPAQVAALFRASLGHPLVETTQGEKLVLGRALGEFYATVQLEPAAAGTRGLVAVTKLSATMNGREATRQTSQHLLSRFPAGSTLLSHMSSVDAQRRSDALTLSNSLGVELNVQHLRQMLEAEGYRLERAAATAPTTISRRQPQGPGATLFFARPGAQAVAVVYREASGNTAIVLNTVTELEPAK
jgi:hypothetical protein